MNVESIELRDPAVASAADFVATSGRALLIAGAPGMGKTSILASVIALHANRSPGLGVTWISGEVIAGEAHLARLLAREPVDEDGVASAGQRAGRMFAIDDADEMLAKRKSVEAALEAALEAKGAHLIGTAHPASVNRLVSSGLFKGAKVQLVGGLEEPAARALVLRRAPSLPARLVGPIVEWAGGHPAAIVYLSRLAEASAAPDPGFLDRAGEFAGAVYAEPWTRLGPQQRAILRQLASTSEGEDSVTSIATSLALPAAHVGAQLGRLVMEGLARPTGVRGRYGVAPLLAHWIARRATRSPSRGGD